MKRKQTLCLKAGAEWIAGDDFQTSCSFDLKVHACTAKQLGDTKKLRSVTDRTCDGRFCKTLVAVLLESTHKPYKYCQLQLLTGFTPRPKDLKGSCGHSAGSPASPARKLSLQVLVRVSIRLENPQGPVDLQLMPRLTHVQSFKRNSSRCKAVGCQATKTRIPGRWSTGLSLASPEITEL